MRFAEMDQSVREGLAKQRAPAKPVQLLTWRTFVWSAFLICAVVVMVANGGGMEGLIDLAFGFSVAFALDKLGG